MCPKWFCYTGDTWGSSKDVEQDCDVVGNEGITAREQGLKEMGCECVGIKTLKNDWLKKAFR